MSGTQRSFIAAAAVVAALSCAQAASAQSILALNSRVGNYTNASTTFVAVPLSDGGGTTLAFNTTVSNQLVVITYNAECGVLGPLEAWVAIEITVDGHLANPASGTQFAFCTSTDSTGVNYSWVGATRQSWVKVATPGTHKVQVLGAGQNGATTWWQGDSSIVVHD